MTILDLLRTPNLRYRTLNFYYNWFVNSFVYYGLSLNSGNLGGDLFVNIFIGGAVEIPAYALSTVALLKTGRRLPLCVSMVVGGVACLCTMIFEKGETDGARSGVRGGVHSGILFEDWRGGVFGVDSASKGHAKCGMMRQTARIPLRLKM